MLPNFSQLRHPPGGEIPFPLPTRTRKDAWGVGTPPISPQARQGAKRENNFIFSFFSQGAITPLEAGLERRGVDTPPTQARPTARVAVASRVNTYLGNILALCMDSVKIIFHLDPVDMMHKGGGDPAYFLPSWARPKIC